MKSPIAEFITTCVAVRSHGMPCLQHVFWVIPPERVSTAPADNSCEKHRCRTPLQWTLRYKVSLVPFGPPRLCLLVMLSSFGFDKGVARRAAPNNSKYVLEVPRGFSVHVFKNPPPPPGFPSTGKPDYPQNRDIANANWTTKPPSSYSSRPELERKQASNPVETRTSQLSAYARVFEPKRPKQQRPYGIYPSAIPDTYIYERSVSSASDVLSSDSSSTSSDSDVNPDIAEFAIEVSSTRASSSTETLETTALDIPAILPSSRPVRSSPSPPSPSQAPVTAATRPTRSPSQSPQTPSYSSAPHTSRRATVEDAFDSDSETVISDGPGAPGFTTSHSQPPTSTGPPRGLGASLPLSTPIRRGSDDSVTRVGNIPPPTSPRLAFARLDRRVQSTMSPYSVLHQVYNPPPLHHARLPLAPLLETLQDPISFRSHRV
ncbi:hypothetical protein BXZ70DRAFT_498007 [Cristinia sonorae]|uniref:Uncharacterized protein n=1 Tax=Cristinia sonorae TaxID=1940300 RepID=A0A8K0UHI0_9AGAR|nr:hypothetical protein BXZ70DRAFT_498007 [Cristinia sonorae]